MGESLQLVQFLRSHCSQTKDALKILFSAEYHELKAIRLYRDRLERRLRRIAKDIEADFRDGILNSICAADHKVQLDILLEDLEILRNASKNIAPWWVLPVVSETAEHLGLERPSPETTIISLQTDGPWVGVLDPTSSSSISQPIPVFACPTDFDSIPLLSALLFHEVGHRWLASMEHSVFDEVLKMDKEAVDAALREVDNKASEWQDEDGSLAFVKAAYRKTFKICLFAYVRELICDEVGRSIGGLAFDVALIVFFSVQRPNSVSRTHPSDRARLEASLTHIRSFTTSLSNEADKRQVEQFVKYGEAVVKGSETSGERLDIGEQFIRRSAQGIARSLVGTWLKTSSDAKSLTKHYLKPASLLKLWPHAEKQLNTKVPLFELVDIKDGTLAPLTAREILGLAALDTMFNSELDRSKNMPMYTSHLKAALDLSPYTISALRAAEPASDLQLWNRRYSLGDSKNHLVVTPTFDPKRQFSASSVDLRLGSVFLTTVTSQVDALSPRPMRDEGIDKSPPPEAYYSRRSVGFGEAFVLHPHQFALAVTLEYIVMPIEAYATVLGRSSWGRLGLNIATATAVNPGFKGRLTLELRNLGEAPLKLIVGARIAQLCFVKCIEGVGEGYDELAESKYHGPTEPEVSKIYTDPDWTLIDDLMGGQPSD